MFAHNGRICEDRDSLALAQVNGSHKMLVCHANIFSKSSKTKKKSNYGIYYYQNLKQQKNSFKIFMTLLLSGKKKK